MPGLPLRPHRPRPAAPPLALALGAARHTALSAALFAALAPPPAWAQASAAAEARRGEPVTLNFVNADIEAVARTKIGRAHV